MFLNVRVCSAAFLAIDVGCGFLFCSDTRGANVSAADGFRKQAEDAR
jgi:hypothetical protein